MSREPSPPERLTSAPICGAKNRAGKPCQLPAIKGKKRCRLHGGKSPGAPKGKLNGNYRHGNYTAEAIAERRAVHALIREGLKFERDI